MTPARIEEIARRGTAESQCSIAELREIAHLALSALRPPAVAPEGEAVAEIEDSDASGEGKYVKWLVSTLSLEAGDFLYLHPAPPAGASEGARVVYQCPRCATSMEIDPSAKPSGK